MEINCFYGLTDPFNEDPVTAVASMDKLAKVIKSAREKQQELAIVMVDLDNLKSATMSLDMMCTIEPFSSQHRPLWRTCLRKLL